VIATAGVFFSNRARCCLCAACFSHSTGEAIRIEHLGSNAAVTISIFVLGFAAFFGGLWLNRKGRRIVLSARAMKGCRLGGPQGRLPAEHAFRQAKSSAAELARVI
jgi:hypothetical protein